MNCRRCDQSMIPENRDEPGRKHKARRLCTSCWNHLWKHRPDELADYPRASLSRAEFVEEYRFLWDAGYRVDQHIATKLGMSLDTMRTARRRAIKAGIHLPLIVKPQTEYV